MTKKIELIALVLTTATLFGCSLSVNNSVQIVNTDVVYSFISDELVAQLCDTNSNEKYTSILKKVPVALDKAFERVNATPEMDYPTEKELADAKNVALSLITQAEKINPKSYEAYYLDALLNADLKKDKSLISAFAKAEQYGQKSTSSSYWSDLFQFKYAINETESYKDMWMKVQAQLKDDSIYVGRKLVHNKVPYFVELSTQLSNKTNVKLSQPINSLTPLEISKQFGPRKDLFSDRQIISTAVSFPGKIGTPIIAPLDGEIIFAEKTVGTGNTIIIKSNTLQVELMHLDSIKVSPRQIITKGEVIGTLGKTGMCTGPNVSMGVYENYIPVDPIKYFK